MVKRKVTKTKAKPKAGIAKVKPRSASSKKAAKAKTTKKKIAARSKSKTTADTSKKAASKSTRKSARSVAKKATARTSVKTKRTGSREAGKAATRTSVSKKTSVAGDQKAPSSASAATSRPKQKLPRVPKTHLTAKELRHFRETLLAKRVQLAGDVEHLTEQALNSKGKQGGGSSTMPIHMADLGSDNWEQEFTLGLIANEEALVREIDQALERIADRTYGVCLATHKPISTERLIAKPWAKYCIDYARMREEGRVP